MAAGEGVQVSRVSAVGVPNSAGSYAAGQDLAPAALRSAGLLNQLRRRGWRSMTTGICRIRCGARTPPRSERDPVPKPDVPARWVRPGRPAGARRYAPGRPHGLPGEAEPGAGPAADRPFAYFEVVDVFEHAGVVRQHRVADPGGVAQCGELDPVRAGRQQPADRQPGDRVDERVEPGRPVRGGHSAPAPFRRSRRTPFRRDGSHAAHTAAAGTAVTAAAVGSP